MDPFGLTEEQRRAGRDQQMIDDLHAASKKMMADIRANMDMISSMPAGTELWCACCQTMHSIEMFR